MQNERDDSEDTHVMAPIKLPNEMDSDARLHALWLEHRYEGRQARTFVGAVALTLLIQAITLGYFLLIWKIAD